jgi:multimeric flavodoxin WrbA
MTSIRKGQVGPPLSRETFSQRFNAHYVDPAFDAERDAIARLETIAWQAHEAGRKAPFTRPAGAGFADPGYELSVEWTDTHARLKQAQALWQDPHTATRVLVINGSARNDGTCPGEISKTWRLANIVRSALAEKDVTCDLLDLSLVTSEYGRVIHPCKGCVSSAMPLCHWPCTCYPNHSLNQVNDWMAEIYERWVAAHGVIILAPTYWYQSPSPLKLMIDRLVCADGGNPDPTSTHGKKVEEAKRIEEKGWDFPKHLAGRIFGVVVHGDVAGIESHHHALADWLHWMGLIDAGRSSQLARHVGYYEPYYSSHDALDKDKAFQDEVRNVARSVAQAVVMLRAGQLPQPDRDLTAPRTK